MDVKEVLCMKGGDGESSYAQNSVFTQKLISITKPILENAVQSLFSKDLYPYEVLNVADLGCSSGPGTVSVISTIVESVEKNCRVLNCQTPELQVYLNDLPGNDFNSLFKGFSGFCKKGEGLLCFVMGAPGSFHGRLFPRNSMHLVHSCFSVHWLSQVPSGLTSKEGLPLNKGKICISKTSPPAVRKAYLAQFQEDFNLFPNSRAEEMVRNGRIVLVLHGRQSIDPSSKGSCYHWELLAEAIADLVSQGLVDEEKLDSFDLPYYTPSQEEVQEVVEMEGSFAIEHMEALALYIGDKQEKDMWARGEKLAKSIRSVIESFIAHQFGEEILEKLFQKFTHLVVELLAKESTKIISILVVLSRKCDRLSL